MFLDIFSVCFFMGIDFRHLILPQNCSVYGNWYHEKNFKTAYHGIFCIYVHHTFLRNTMKIFTCAVLQKLNFFLKKIWSTYWYFSFQFHWCFNSKLVIYLLIIDNYTKALLSSGIFSEDRQCKKLTVAPSDISIFVPFLNRRFSLAPIIMLKLFSSLWKNASVT